MMFSIGGMLLFPASNDLLTMFVALEILSLPLYLLCGLARRRRLLSQEAALKYFMLGAFSSGFFLYGIALVYGFAGSMQFGDIAEAVAGAHRRPSVLLLGGIGLIAVGLLFKVGAAPFHAWTPDVYQGAPTAVTAFMAACTKVAAFGALLRLFYVAFGAARWDWTPMIWVDRDPDHGGRQRPGASPSPTSSGCWPTPRSRTPGFILVGFVGLHTVDSFDGARALLDPGGAVLPGDLRLHDHRRVRRRHGRPRRRGRGDAPVPVGRPRQGVADRGRGVRVLPARRWPASR